MPSRGVVFGDLMRADDQWNDRIRASLESQGVGVGDAGTVEPETSDFLHADTWAPEDKAVLMDHVRSYFGVTELGPFFELAYGAVAHATAVGVLAERQRWDGEGLSIREARLEGLLREALDVVSTAGDEGNGYACDLRRRIKAVLCD